MEEKFIYISVWLKKNLRENSQSLFYKQLLSNERTFILKIDFTDNSKNFRLIFFPAKTSTWWQRIDSGICILQYFLFKPRYLFVSCQNSMAQRHKRSVHFGIIMYHLLDIVIKYQTYKRST